MDGSNRLCKVDEVGELCISSSTVGDGYWGLHGKTNQVFNVSSISRCQLLQFQLSMMLEFSQLKITWPFVELVIKCHDIKIDASSFQVSTTFGKFRISQEVFFIFFL